MEEKIAFSTNSVGTTGHPKKKKKSEHRPYALHRKLTQNGSQI